MNPFLESTVARALPRHLRARYWARGLPVGADSSAATAASATPAAPATPAASGTDVKSEGQDDAVASPESAESSSSDRQRPSSCTRRMTVTGAASMHRPRDVRCWRWRQLVVLPLLAGVLAFPWPAMAVDANTASVDELRAVRGIGPKTAQQIVAERTRGGPYASLSDLSDRVRGIGPRKAAALETAGLTVQSGSSAATAGSSGTGAAPADAARPARR